MGAAGLGLAVGSEERPENHSGDMMLRDAIAAGAISACLRGRQHGMAPT
jgi:hypothetical protein